MDQNLDLSAMIGKIMSDKALMNNIKSAISGIGGTESTDTAPQKEALPENFAAQLPNLLSSLSSESKDADAAIASPKPNHEKSTAYLPKIPSEKNRENGKRLLNALKPYLSQNRCEAIDYLLSLSEITSLASVLLPTLQNSQNSKQGE